MRDRGWWERAACAGAPTKWFFPGQGEVAQVAKGICGRCPVRAECLQDALSWPIYHDFGIRGGTTPLDRKRLRRANGSG